jgi:antitoxin (DNA-binding transcriptional repressor) of toxin-antitoxin stability system
MPRFVGPTVEKEVGLAVTRKREHPDVGAGLDRRCERLYKVYMKTLTITDAKKNLGRWLAAASRGEDIGIVCGADIIALRKVEVESTDYAQREYGATPEQVDILEKATDRRYRTLKRARKLVTVTAEQLRKMIE